MESSSPSSAVLAPTTMQMAGPVPVPAEPVRKQPRARGSQRQRPRNTRSRLVVPIAVAATALAWMILSPSVAEATGSSSAQKAPRKRQAFPAFNAPPNSPHRSSLLEEVLSAPLDVPSSSSAIIPGQDEICHPTGQIHDACCDYETVEKSLNTPKFYATLQELVKQNYFRYYKVDLYKECPFWHDNGLCMNRACAVEKASENEIPEEYRESKLSGISTTDETEIGFHADHAKSGRSGGQLGKSSSPSLHGKAGSHEEHPSSDACTCRDEDFCHWEDEEMSDDAVWVDLINNPERFTGYAGPSANQVWKSIYEENCFGAVPKGSFIEPARSKASGGTGFVNRNQLLGGDGFDAAGSSSALGGGGLRGLMPSLEAPVDPASQEQCLEKRVFYRVISGLHASISTHICSEFLDQKTGEWAPNLECFVTRIAQHPERLQNVYFNYVLLLRALARAGDYLTNFRLKRGDAIPSSEQRTLSLLSSLVSQANACPPTFDEATMFHPTNPESHVLKTQFRDHFRNVSSIMDCVGCDRCRLWGKMQVNGLGTAMKILFSFDEEQWESGQLDPSPNPDKNPTPLLERGELVALINTLHRFAESLKAVETFREIYQREILAKQAKERDAERAAAEEKKRGQEEQEQEQRQRQGVSSSRAESDQRYGQVEAQVPPPPPPPVPVEINHSASQPHQQQHQEGRQARPSASSHPPFLPVSVLEKVTPVLTTAYDACRSSAWRCLGWVIEASQRGRDLFDSVTRGGVGGGGGQQKSGRGNARTDL